MQPLVVALVAIAGVVVVGLTIGLSVGLTQRDKNSSTSATTSAESSDTCTACTLVEEVTEGPYYLDEQLIRTNITEGQTGLKLILNVTVVDTNCKPVVGAFVDVWHANATGSYSGFTGSGTSTQGITDETYSTAHVATTDTLTWLRGIAVTDSTGTAMIYTIYPGHYTGRATHIHGKVHVTDLTSATTELQSYQSSHVAHTGQMFFNDSLSTSIYALSPYSTVTSSRTLNGDDTWYKSGGETIQIPCAWPLVDGDLSKGLFAHIKWEMDPTATAAVVSRRRLQQMQQDADAHRAAAAAA